MAGPPPLPPGFTLDGPARGAPPPLPPGFTLDSAPAAAPVEEMATDPMGASTGMSSPPPPAAPVAPAPPSAGPGRGGDPRQYPNEPVTATGVGGNLTGGFNTALARGVYAPEIFVKDMLGMDSSSAKRARDGAIQNLDKFPAQNGWDRAARSAGETTAAAMPLIVGMPAAGAAGAGEALAQTSAQLTQGGLKQGASMARELLSTMLKGSGAAPMAAAGADALSTATSGAGAQRMTESFPDNPIATMMGALLGGFAPQLTKVGPVTLAGKAGKKVVDTAIQHAPASEGTTARLARERGEKLDWQNAEPGTTAYDAPAPVSEKRGYVGKIQDRAADVQMANAERKVMKDVEREIGIPAERPAPLPDNLPPLSDWEKQNGAYNAPKPPVQGGTPETRANMARDAELKATLGPDYKPTLAESSGSANMLNKQKELEARMSGPELIARQEQQKTSRGTVDKFADNAVPNVPGGNSEAVLAARAKQLAEDADVPLAAKAADIENRARDTTAKTFPENDDKAVLGSTAATTGKTGPVLRQQYEGNAQANEIRTQELKAAIDPEGTYRRSSADLNVGLRDAVASEGTDLMDPVIPKEVRTLLGNTATPAPQRGGYTPGPGPEAMPTAPDHDVASLLDAKFALQKRARELGGSTSATVNQRNAINNALDVVNREINAIGSEPLAPQGIRERLNAFNEHYRETVAPEDLRYTAGDVNAGRAANGEPNLQDSKIPKSALSSPEDAAQLANVAPKGSPGFKATVSAALDDIRAQPGAIKDGQFQPEALQAWGLKHRAALEEHPDLREAIRRKDPAGTQAAIQKLNAERDAAADASLNKALGGDATKALKEGVDNPSKMADIVERAGKDPESKAALKRSAWDRILEKGDGAAVQEYLDSKPGKQVFNQVFGDDPQHLKDLRTIIDANRTLDQTKPVKGSPPETRTPGSVIKDVTGSSAASLISQGNTLAQGRTQPLYVLGVVGSRLLNKFTEDQANAVMKRVIFDPDIAAQVAGIARGGKMTPQQADRLSAFIPLLPYTTDKGDVQDTQPLDIVVKKPRPK